METGCGRSGRCCRCIRCGRSGGVVGLWWFWPVSGRNANHPKGTKTMVCSTQRTTEQLNHGLCSIGWPSPATRQTSWEVQTASWLLNPVNRHDNWQYANCHDNWQWRHKWTRQGCDKDKCGLSKVNKGLVGHIQTLNKAEEWCGRVYIQLNADIYYK